MVPRRAREKKTGSFLRIPRRLVIRTVPVLLLLLLLTTMASSPIKPRSSASSGRNRRADSEHKRASHQRELSESNRDNKQRVVAAAMTCLESTVRNESI